MILQFLREAGPVVIPLILLAVVLVFLALWNALSLLLRGAEKPERRRSSIDSILFWGSVAAILGFLGQWIGILKLTKFIAQEGVVNPSMVVLGLSEALLTTVTGMMLLCVSAFLWFLLRVGLWTAERRA